MEEYLNVKIVLNEDEQQYLVFLKENFPDEEIAKVCNFEIPAKPVVKLGQAHDPELLQELQLIGGFDKEADRFFKSALYSEEKLEYVLYETEPFNTALPLQDLPLYNGKSEWQLEHEYLGNVMEIEEFEIDKKNKMDVREYEFICEFFDVEPYANLFKD